MQSLLRSVSALAGIAGCASMLVPSPAAPRYVGRGAPWRRHGSASLAMELRELKGPGSKDRMKLYDLTGTGVILPPQFNQWVDKAVERVTARSTGEEVILPYQDDARWLWRQFRDTVLEVSWQVVLGSIVLGSVTVAVLNTNTGTDWLQVPDADDELVRLLLAVQIMWGYMLTLSTFILTFFLKECYDYWGIVMDLSRKIQGRIMDINLLVSSYAARGEDGERPLPCLSCYRPAAGRARS